MLRTMAIAFRQRPLPIDIDFGRHGFSDWQGSSIVGLPERNQVLFHAVARLLLAARVPTDDSEWTRTDASAPLDGG